MPPALSSLAADLAGFAASLALWLGYQAFLRARLKRDPAYTLAGINVIARSAWIECVMRERRDILAVQTLRNSTMAATFLASTSIVLILGVLTVAAQSAGSGAVWHALNAFGATAPEVLLIKLMPLLLDLFAAFFAFSMSIRLFNHVGYMVALPADAHPAFTPRHVAAHLNRAGRYYSLGMRAYYLLVPLVFWLFGPHFMLAASVVLIAALHHLDRAPSVPHPSRPGP